MSEKTVHALVSGLVQQVGFRQSCRQVARSLELVGWVGNLPDGRVEVIAQGDETAMDRFVEWLWSGPSLARVTSVESNVVARDRTLRDFFIHPNPTKSR